MVMLVWAEKLGMIPNDGPLNPFKPQDQYKHGMSVYEAFISNPVAYLDPYGLWHYDIEDPVKRSKQQDRKSVV